MTLVIINLKFIFQTFIYVTIYCEYQMWDEKISIKHHMQDLKTFLILFIFHCKN